MLRLGIVDDHPVARRGLAAILGEDPEMAVEASAALPAQLPDPAGLDLVLCDLYLGDDVPAVASVRALAAVTRVLMVSAASRPSDVLACVAAEAAGYVTKDADEAALREAVRQVAAGGFHVSPQLAGIVGAASRSASAAGRASLLSPREEEALGWIARGMTHGQAARRMGVATSTVDTYIQRIRARLHLGNKAELAWFARNLAEAMGEGARDGGAALATGGGDPRTGDEG
ncbi:response regulator [Streptomyces hoynatensis]|uniref:DNA-binding response regulator n=1 Tax=Streptomyces hoynatensis TaxID=1141874 RepID=A0A3A9Z4U3_9ACTN|nr:response regulator transcription factor [Streptomyces hoynatensis]RKN43079.1 DNA-binding response regulator [Streptomyces hoynatensis]